MKKFLGSIMYLVFPRELDKENEKPFKWGEIVSFYGIIAFLIIVTILFN